MKVNIEYSYDAGWEVTPNEPDNCVGYEIPYEVVRRYHNAKEAFEAATKNLQEAALAAGFQHWALGER